MEPSASFSNSAIHLWHIPIPLDSGLSDKQLLSKKERQRLARLVNQPMRRLYLATHQAKREILARYLDTDAKELALGETEFGKPFIDRSLNRTLEFNISHTGDYAIIAISPTAVGVDLEASNRRVNVTALARRYFDSSTVTYLERLTPNQRSQVFVRLWTQYEAYKKATGRGLRGGDAPLKLRLTTEPNAFVSFADPVLQPHWLLAELDSVSGHALSLVTSRNTDTLPLIEQFDYATGTLLPSLVSP